jgi:hypothetical protein
MSRGRWLRSSLVPLLEPGGLEKNREEKGKMKAGKKEDEMGREKGWDGHFGKIKRQKERE